MNKSKEYWIDSARNQFNQMKATDCIQTHEDMLVGNSIRVIEYSAYQELLDQLNSIPEHHWRDVAAQNILLEQKLNKAIEALEFYASGWTMGFHAGELLVSTGIELNFEEVHQRARKTLKEIKGK